MRHDARLQSIGFAVRTGLGIAALSASVFFVACRVLLS